MKAEVERRTDGNVTVLYDEKGYPSYMLIIPQFRVENIDPNWGTGIHPAFIVAGEVYDRIYIGAFTATEVKGRAISMPDYGARYSVTFDEARFLCTVKGVGWHLMTNWEWAAVSLYCTKNNLEKYFNREWWEWVDGLKLLDGELYFPRQNNFEYIEDTWERQGVFFDDRDNYRPILSAEIKHFTEEDPRGKNDTRDEGYTSIKRYKELEISDTYKALPKEKREVMAQMMIEPSKIHEEVPGGLWVRNYGERMPIRGGNWSHGANAGLAALYLNLRRVFSYHYVGFRPAFIDGQKMRKRGRTL
ncbi:MAG: hypothetical protein LBF78_00020 [Treponema sp.]|nr:hypothetical protein [Treponema sp.]